MGTIRKQIKYDQWGNEIIPDWLEYYGIKPHTGTYKSKLMYQIVDNKVIMKKEIVVHTFRMGDVDDPDLYAAEPIYQWQKSDAGKWVMENYCNEAPIWHRHADPTHFGYTYTISATFEDKKLTEFYLRFGKPTK
jgi:hypothetical protein